jgi:hypothetical protein
LTPERVLEIRKAFSGGSSFDEIGAQFQVHRTTAWKICTYRTHKDIGT